MAKKIILFFALSAAAYSLVLAAGASLLVLALYDSARPAITPAQAGTLTPMDVIREGDKVQMIITMGKQGPEAYTLRYEYAD